MGCSVRVLEETYAHVVGDAAPLDFLDGIGAAGQSGAKRGSRNMVVRRDPWKSLE